MRADTFGRNKNGLMAAHQPSPSVPEAGIAEPKINAVASTGVFCMDGQQFLRFVSSRFLRGGALGLWAAAVASGRMTVFIFLLLFFSLPSQAASPYHSYLLTKLYSPIRPLVHHAPYTSAAPARDASIPRYQIPKGNIFCRMEDKLTKATGVWMKVGVQ